MRLVVARRLGGRGEGLGNEILSWSKGFVASAVLQAKLIGPSWGLNKRKYYQHFGTNRLDFLAEELARRLPHYAFQEQDYRRIGVIDFGRSIELWAEEIGLTRKSSFIVTVDGMYGGYPCISNARPFLWSKLLNSRDALSNIYGITSRLDPSKLFVAVHMRSGADFGTGSQGENLRGRFNMRLPASWYLNACEALQQAFGDRIQFHIFTDRRGPEFEEAVARFNPGQKPQRGLTECSDLALMAMADVRICSVSSYSLVASFLADGPYLWYEPQLQYDNGAYTLWGHEASQREISSPTSEALAWIESLKQGAVDPGSFKGWPFGMGTDLPTALLSDLKAKLLTKSSKGNLLAYGAIPEWALATAHGTR